MILRPRHLVSIDGENSTKTTASDYLQPQRKRPSAPRLRMLRTTRMKRTRTTSKTRALMMMPRSLVTVAMAKTLVHHRRSLLVPRRTGK